MILMSIKEQFVDDNLAVIVSNALPKTIVNRLLNQNGIPTFCEITNQRADCKDNTRSADRRVWIDLPIMTSLKPICKHFKIRFVRFGISENAVSGFCGKGFPYGGRCLEIHVRHPHWQKAIWFAAFFCEIIFETVRMIAWDDLVEIIIHVGFSQSYFSKACRRSSIRSVAFSMPTDMRRKRSLIPRLRRSSSGTSACV